jgi:hypothetical protein
MDAQSLALEAERLLKDTVLQMALKAMRDEAFDMLVRAEPNDQVAIMQAQQTVKIIDGFNEIFRRHIVALENSGSEIG